MLSDAGYIVRADKPPHLSGSLCLCGVFFGVVSILFLVGGVVAGQIRLGVAGAACSAVTGVFLVAGGKYCYLRDVVISSHGISYVGPFGRKHLVERADAGRVRLVDKGLWESLLYQQELVVIEVKGGKKLVLAVDQFPSRKELLFALGVDDSGTAARTDNWGHP